MYTSFLPEHLNLKFAITANVKITSQDSPGYYGHGSLQEVVTMVTLTLYELHDIASQLSALHFRCHSCHHRQSTQATHVQIYLFYDLIGYENMIYVLSDNLFNPPGNLDPNTGPLDWMQQ